MRTHGARIQVRLWRYRLQKPVEGRKLGLIVNFLNFHPPGCGSAFPIRIRIQDSQTHCGYMRIRIHNTASVHKLSTLTCPPLCASRSRRTGAGEVRIDVFYREHREIEQMLWVYNESLKLDNKVLQCKVPVPADQLWVWTSGWACRQKPGQ
jgi:hypothetical protein